MIEPIKLPTIKQLYTPEPATLPSTIQGMPNYQYVLNSMASTAKTPTTWQNLLGGVEGVNNNLTGLLNKGLDNANTFNPTSLAIGLGKSAVNATLGAFGNKPADIHSTTGKITQGIENSGVLPMLGPVGLGLQAGFTAFNIFDNALGKKSKLQGTVGMDIAGYNQDLNPLAGKKFSWTAKSKRK